MAALCAAAERARAPRRRAEARACRESAMRDAARRLSLLSAFSVARERFAEIFSPRWPLRYALCAPRRVFSDVLPLAGGRSFTPARRAWKSLMAIACLVERAPCFPSRMWRISSRTNSPACVLGDFPSRASLRARSSVLFSGISISFIFLHAPECDLRFESVRCFAFHELWCHSIAQKRSVVLQPPANDRGHGLVACRAL